MANKEIIGKVKVVAKTKGILLEGDESWYNPKDDKVKEYVKPEFRGKEVVLTMTDKENVFSFIKLSDGKVPVEVVSDEEIDTCGLDGPTWGMCYNQSWQNAREFERTYEDAKKNFPVYLRDALELVIKHRGR